MAVSDHLALFYFLGVVKDCCAQSWNTRKKSLAVLWQVQEGEGGGLLYFMCDWNDGNLGGVKTYWQLPLIAVGSAFAIIAAPAASWEAVQSQVGCVWAMSISVQNQFASAFHFNNPPRWNSNQEVCIKSELWAKRLQDRGPCHFGKLTFLHWRKLPSNDQCLHNVVCIFTAGSEFENINQVLVRCTALLWPRSSNRNSFDIWFFSLKKKKHPKDQKCCWEQRKEPLY